MEDYHKINAPGLRDGKGKLLKGTWSVPELEYLKNNRWQFTEKVNGTNIRIGFGVRDDKFYTQIGGRTKDANLPATLVNSLNELIEPVASSMESIARERELDSVIIYGEGYGAKINGGGKYRPDQGFVAFDILIGRYWMDRREVDSICHALGFDVVPIVGYGTLDYGINIVNTGLKSEWGNFDAEGIVARPEVQMFDRQGKRIITKITARDYA